MVDVEIRHPGGLTPSHAAGLRRLAARAAASTTSHYSFHTSSSTNKPSPSPSPSPSSSSPAFLANGACRSYAPLAEAILTRLRVSGVPVLPGLSPLEFAVAEAEIGSPFPPDLRAVLSLGVPSAAGFPDWRSLPSLRPSLHLPLASLSLLASRRSYWHPSWGPRPADDSLALSLARSSLRRAPPLVPLLDHFYIPSSPSLPGNPVFLLDPTSGISIYAADLSEFFLSLSLSSPVLLRRTPRWVDFWFDAASVGKHRRRLRRRRSSSSSCSSLSSSSSCSSDLPPAAVPSPEEYLEIRIAKVPNWVEEYLDGIAESLRGGGWPEDDVREVIEVPPASGDALAVPEELLVRADALSDALRRSGWASDDVADVLGFDLPPSRRRAQAAALPPAIARKIGELAAAVSLS